MIAWLCYQVPNIQLSISVQINKMSMLDEVARLQTIIILLMHHTHITPQVILDWMVTFSDIFYIPLNKVKNDYNKLGGTKALRLLLDEVSFKPLKRLIRSLALAEEKMALEDAFAGLEQDRKYSEEIRRDNTEAIVENRVAVGTRLSKISAGTTISLYLVAPVVYGVVLLLLETFSKMRVMM